MHDQTKKSSRRAFLQRLSFAAGAGSLFAACRAEPADETSAAGINMAPGEKAAFSCTDVSNLTEQEIQTRESLEYVDDSPHAEKKCNNCQFFEAPDAGEQCGGCQVVPGPIHPQGHCTSWVAAEG